MLCINCGIATKRLRRHVASSLPADLLTSLARWLGIQVPTDAIICHPCYELLNSKATSDVRWLGHTLVCIACGHSVRSVQCHAVERNDPMLQNLPKSHPAFLQNENYACHPCWMRHQRKTKKDQDSYVINTSIGSYDSEIETSPHDSSSSPGSNGALYNLRLLASPIKEQSPVRKKKKNPHEQKLVTGYILFSSELRRDVVAKNPGCSFGQLARLVGSQWSSLPASTKMSWSAKAAKYNQNITAQRKKESQELVKCHNPQNKENPEQMLPEICALIVSVHRYLQREYEQLKTLFGSSVDLSVLSNIVRRTAEATDVSEDVVNTILYANKRPAEPVEGNGGKRARLDEENEEDDSSDSQQKPEQFEMETLKVERDVDDDGDQNDDEETENLKLKLEFYEEDECRVQNEDEETESLRLEYYEEDKCKTANNYQMADKPDDPMELTDLSLPSSSDAPGETQGAAASTSAAPTVAAPKSSAQRQREYRQRVAASRTPAQLKATRMSETERKRNYRLRKAANLYRRKPSSLESTTASSSRSAGRSNDVQNELANRQRPSLAAEPARTTVQPETPSNRIEVRLTSTFLDNDFAYTCSVCDRLTNENDLKPITAAQLEVISDWLIDENRQLCKGEYELVCDTCKLSLDKKSMPSLAKVRILISSPPTRSTTAGYHQ